ncbi:MAG: Gfo/Idh/MocA family oxidoreductase [Proteobacteria bacterium]|nr:Gfo/Idh/MocA family oxidoreductase [Pseudomonadota bacterium]
MRSALVIGAGSYAVGDSFGHGVVLPSLIELVRAGKIADICIAVRSPRSPEFWSRVEGLKAEMGSDIEIREFVFTGLGDLEGLDLSNTAAFVCVPDTAHEEYLDFFVDNGVPTWVVKPLCGAGPAASKVAGKARRAAVPLWVDYHKRFDSSNRLLKEHVDSGAHGRMLLYSVQYSQPATIPLSDLKVWSSDVNVFQYLGCHYVDQVLFLHPESTPERVSATGLPGSLKSSGGPEYDIVHAVVDFRLASGALLRADFNIAWNDPAGATAKSHQRVEAQFEQGRVIADNKRRGFELWGNEKMDDINPYFFQLYADLDEPGIKRATGYGFGSIANFIDRMDDAASLESPLLPWAWNVLWVDAVIDGVRESIEAGGEWRSLKASL